MVLTDITREEEKRMKKNEKQIIISLGVAIAVVAIALIAMMITSGSSDNGQSSSLKDAVQQESNGNGSDDVSESDAGESVSEEDAGESGDNMTTEQPTTQETTTEEATTEEATTAAKNNTASNVMDADDGYIFPDADTSYVSKSSVKKLSDEELQYAVNEVYARHGLKFTKKKNKERFEKKEWYVGTVDDQDDISLNKYEKKNVDTMAAELKKRGLR